MTQTEEAHATGARLLRRLDAKGSSVSTSPYSSSLALVSDAHWLTSGSQCQAGRGWRGNGPQAAAAQRSCCVLEGSAQSLGSLTSLSSLTQNNSYGARGFTPHLHGCCCTKNRCGETLRNYIKGTGTEMEKYIM